MNKLKKTALSLIAISAITTSLMAATELKQDQLNKIVTEYPKLFSQPNIKVVKGVSHGDFNEIILEAQTPQGAQKFSAFTSDKIGNAVFFGKAFNKDQVPYEIPGDISIVKDGVAFSMGTGSKQIYLITDPECPYCQKLDTSIKPEALKEYTINVIPYPLPFHQAAKPMMYWVLDGKTNDEKVERMHKVMSGDKTFEKFSPSVEAKTKADVIFEKAMKAVTEVNAGGTPTILDENLKPVHFSVIGDVR